MCSKIRYDGESENFGKIFSIVQVTSRNHASHAIETTRKGSSCSVWYCIAHLHWHKRWRGGLRRKKNSVRTIPIETRCGLCSWQVDHDACTCKIWYPMGHMSATHPHCVSVGMVLTEFFCPTKGRTLWLTQKAVDRHGLHGSICPSQH
jgi:hypothetical protein